MGNDSQFSLLSLPVGCFLSAVSGVAAVVEPAGISQFAQKKAAELAAWESTRLHSCASGLYLPSLTCQLVFVRG